MKNSIKVILFLLLIILPLLFYKIYFLQNDQFDIVSNKSQKLIIPNEIQNDLIENLKYEVNLDDTQKYSIVSKYSKLSYENNIEIIYMNDVEAVIFERNGQEIKINSDKASYNTENSNTYFRENVKIKYINHAIIADYLKLDFIDNLMVLENNINYTGPLGNLIADNIELNLITKQIDIFMNNKDSRVLVNKN